VITLDLEKIKKSLQPTKKKVLASIGIFVALIILTYPANIFFTFHQGFGSPLPFYVWSICIGDGCPEVVTGIRPLFLAFNILFCYLMASLFVQRRSEKE